MDQNDGVPVTLHLEPDSLSSPNLNSPKLKFFNYWLVKETNLSAFCLLIGRQRIKLFSFAKSQAIILISMLSGQWALAWYQKYKHIYGGNYCARFLIIVYSFKLHNALTTCPLSFANKLSSHKRSNNWRGKWEKLWTKNLILQSTNVWQTNEKLLNLTSNQENKN